jgi:hypothetical protein
VKGRQEECEGGNGEVVRRRDELESRDEKRRELKKIGEGARGERN